MNRITNKKSILVAAIAVALSTTVLAGPKGEQGSSHGQPFLALQAQIDETNANLDALAANNAASITAIETNIANLESDIVGLQNQIDSNDMDISDLQDATGDNADAIATLEAETADLQDQINALTAEVATKQDVLNGSGACPGGYSIRVINPDGSYLCEYDDVGGGSGYISNIYSYGHYAWVSSGQYQYGSYAYCPSGYMVTGGGIDAYYGGYGRSVATVDSRPHGNAAWYAEASRMYYSYYGNYIRAVAMCVPRYH
jgi:hypothetical protein